MFVMAYHSFLASADVDLNDGARHFLVGPFDEFNVRWYLVVGVAVVLSVALQIVVPHLGVLWTRVALGWRRCRDRGWTCSKRRTKQVIQKDYERLNIGPAFIL